MSRVCKGLFDHPTAARLGHRRFVSIASELGEISGPHFLAEQAVLTPENLPDLITAKELGGLLRDIGMHWNRPT